jgi:hypothetical protein
MPSLVPDAFDSVRQNLSSRRKQFSIEIVLAAIGHQGRLSLAVQAGVWSAPGSRGPRVPSTVI